MRVADEEKLETARVEPGVHPQLNGSRRRARAPDRSQGRQHLERRLRRALGVPVALVEEQERVSAELEQATAERVRLLEECREGRSSSRPLLPRHPRGPARGVLRHRREAGDVNEVECPVELRATAARDASATTGGSAEGRTRRARPRCRIGRCRWWSSRGLCADHGAAPSSISNPSRAMRGGSWSLRSSSATSS